MPSYRMNKFRLLGGCFFIGLAVSITMSEIILHIYSQLHRVEYDVSRIDMFVALVIGFIGLYILNPKRAKDGGAFIVDNSVKVVQVVRNGRRKSDALNAIVENDLGDRHTIEIPTPPHEETEVPIEQLADVPHRRSTDRITGEHPNGPRN